MATTYTTNYNLGKQENHADKFDMDVITDNADKIDAALTAKADKSTTYTKTEVDTALSGKQATLTTAQLDAVNSGITSADVTQIGVNENNISSLTEEYNQLGYILYARYLSDLTFTKSLGGLYYSNDIDISSDFDEVFAAGLANFSNVPNIAINTMLKENKSICVVICDPTNPASLSFSAGSITIRVFGRKK